MALLQQLLENPGAKVIGFAGGKGRNHLANEMAAELKRAGKKVVMSHLKIDMLPGEGHIVYHQKNDELLKKIKTAFTEHAVVYAGKGLNDHFVKGISEQLTQKIAALPEADYLLLLVGPAKRASILAPRTIDQIAGFGFLDQLIYSFEFDMVDLPVDDTIIEDPDRFFESFPQHKGARNFSQALISDYLRDAGNGALKFFRGKYPALLVFTDINNPLLENRAINLAREIFSPDIAKIYLANLKESFIKKVSMDAK